MTSNFGELVTAAYDPIEKKPLYHFYPGQIIFSTGANGCSFKCTNCQNFDISQNKVPTRYVSPEELVVLAGRHGSMGVAYTYSEPLIWFEYIKKTGTLIHEAGMKNVLVTNGYINPEPLKEMLPLIDAANIDLKSMSPKFYKRICKGRLEPVLENIKCFYEAGVKIEVTNLVIPDLNDSRRDFEQITDFVAGISDKIPLHFSAYYPTHKMSNPPTPPTTLLQAYDVAVKKVKYVYLGNVHLPDKSDTFCPNCGTKVIERSGYRTEKIAFENGKCTNCSYDLEIVG
jgi:pyruvate formate lyase activating enzyme